MGKSLMTVLALCCLLLTGAAFAEPSDQTSKGHFRAEQLTDVLEKAASKLEDGLSIKGMLSRPYKANGKVVVDFSPPGYPRGMHFSLDNMLPDNSSNTLSFSLEPQDGARPNGDMIMICVLIVLYSCPPGEDEDGELARRIDNAISSGQSITINGWTYAGSLDNDAPFFSATAGPGIN